MFEAKPYTQGKIGVYSGPAKAGKTSRIEGFLDSLVDSGHKDGDNVLVFRHPKDDFNPEKIGKHEIEVTDSVRNISQMISSKTRTIIVAGAAHFYSDFLALAEAIVRSNRNLYVTGLNLDERGKPYGIMPGLMAIADEIELVKSICSHPSCSSDKANRIIETKGIYYPVCSHHYHHDSPPVAQSLEGQLELFVGCMFASKSTEFKEKIRKTIERGLDYLVFQYRGDRFVAKKARKFSKGNIALHSGKKIDSVLVDNAQDIESYLSEKPKITNIFIDELQFIRGIYDFAFRFIPKGYKITGTGLPRGFNRREFGELPALMCLADSIKMYHAICVKCGHPATESQRIKIIGRERIEANFDDPLVMPGASESYEARCLSCWNLPGEPELKYQLPKLKINSYK